MSMPKPITRIGMINSEKHPSSERGRRMTLKKTININT